MKGNEATHVTALINASATTALITTQMNEATQVAPIHKNNIEQWLHKPGHGYEGRRWYDHRGAQSLATTTRPVHCSMLLLCTNTTRVTSPTCTVIKAATAKTPIHRRAQPRLPPSSPNQPVNIICCIQVWVLRLHSTWNRQNQRWDARGMNWVYFVVYPSVRDPVTSYKNLSRRNRHR